MLEPGECFGHPSLLTGMAPAFTVRAREPSTLRAAQRRGRARRVLGTEAGAAYVATSMRKRLTRAGPHRPRAARCRHDAGVGDHAPGRVLRARRARSARPRRGSARTACRRCSSALDGDQGSGSSPTPTVRARGGVERASRSTRRCASSRARRCRRCRPGSSRSRRRSTCSPRGREHVAVVDGDACAASCPPPTCSASTRAARSRCDTRSWALPTRTALVRAVERLPQLFRLLVRAGRAAPRPRAGAQPPARRGGRAADRFLDLEHGPAPVAVGVARPGERGAAGVHARLRPGQRARLRRRPRRTRRPDGRCLLRAAGLRRQRRPGQVRDRPRQQRRARPQAPVADVEGGLAADLRRVPARARRVAPDPRDRRRSTSARRRAVWPSPPS